MMTPYSDLNSEDILRLAYFEIKGQKESMEELRHGLTLKINVLRTALQKIENGEIKDCVELDAYLKELGLNKYV